MGEAEAAPPTGIAEAGGSSLLLPPADRAVARRRRERTAEIGRRALVLLGAVCAGAGAALWATSSASLPALGFVAFGGVLVVLGLALYALLRRDRELAPEEAHVWDEGIEILLKNGEIRAASWIDPDLALAILVRFRRRSAEPDRLLCWRMDHRVPPADLSAEGLDRMLQAAASHDVVLSQERQGRSARAPRFYAIEGRRPAPGARPRAKTTEPPPADS